MFSRQSQRMDNYIVVWNVTQYLDNATLKKLYLSSAIPSLLSVAKDENWWRSRVETLLKRRILDNVIGEAKNESWRLTYVQLENTNRAWRDEVWKKDNILTVRIILWLGSKINKGHVFLACYYESIKILNFLVENDICSTLGDYDQPLVVATKEKKVEIVRSLLSNPKIDIAKHGSRALGVTMSGSADASYQIAKMLIDHGAVPARGDVGYCVNWCENMKTFALVLSHPESHPEDNDNKALKLATEYGKIEALKLLLADYRVNPTPYRDELFRLAEDWPTREEIIAVLMSDKRIASLS